MLKQLIIKTQGTASFKPNKKHYEGILPSLADFRYDAT